MANIVDRIGTAPLAAAGLIGGYSVARATGVRPLGGVALFAAGAAAAQSWYTKQGPVTAAVLSTVYLGGFGASHPLAKKVGAWPSVLGVAAVAAGAAYFWSDSRPAQS